MTRDGRGWRVDGAPFGRVIVATSAVEAARLIEPLDAAWAATVRALRYEAIVTVYARAPSLRLAEPMLLLREDERRPAQFGFDHGQRRGEAGLMAFVVSGARPWVERGLDATTAAVMRQAADALGASGAALVPLRALIEKRATFRCTPGLRRPPSVIADGLAAAADYVDGPYPATLEGAVRAGRDAVRALG